MRSSSRLGLFVGLLAVGLACWLTFVRPAEAQEKEKEKAVKWEYKVVRPESNRRDVAEDKMEKLLNKLGEEGWECTGTVSEVVGSEVQGTWTHAVVILKRPKR